MLWSLVTISYDIEKDIEDSRMNDIIAIELHYVGLIYTIRPLRCSCT